jgi:hypothetical protein
MLGGEAASNKLRMNNCNIIEDIELGLLVKPFRFSPV